MNFLRLISAIQLLFLILLRLFCVYQFAICIWAFFKVKVSKPLYVKDHRFMVVIPARNEERTIINLIKSLRNQNYPSNLLDIYVIADNCTDNTANLARQNDAIVYERFDDSKRSKGYALEWFFDIVLDQFPDKYDAFCLFDADNIVSPDFIKEMNLKLCTGEVIVQGYRDIKNIHDNWLTQCYALFYWTMNKFYHYSRYKLGLSPLINGTGFMVALSVIKENNGWHTETLTEDIEFSLNSIAKGYKIGWAKDAICYDEQPTAFDASCSQRLRWSVGHIQCFLVCLPKLLQDREFSYVKIDAALYTLGMPLLLLSIIYAIIDGIKYLILPFVYPYPIKGCFYVSLWALFLSLFQVITITVIEKKSFKKMWKGIATYPVFLVSWFVINVLAFFNLKMSWKPIEHTKALEIKELR